MRQEDTLDNETEVSFLILMKEVKTNENSCDTENGDMSEMR